MTKESIKMFLAPNRKKILLFILLSVMLPAISFLTGNSLSLFWFNYTYIESQSSDEMLTGGVSLDYFMPFVFAIIYFYFLSCFLIFLYRKIKSKKLK